METRTCGISLLTPHGPEDYPGLRVVRPGPGWRLGILCVEEGQSFVACGGEQVYAYETPDGGRAEGFVLGPGDRATLVRTGLPFSLGEWRLERAAKATSP